MRMVKPTTPVCCLPWNGHSLVLLQKFDSSTKYKIKSMLLKSCHSLPLLQIYFLEAHLSTALNITSQRITSWSSYLQIWALRSPSSWAPICNESTSRAPGCTPQHDLDVFRLPAFHIQPGAESCVLSSKERYLHPLLTSPLFHSALLLATPPTILPNMPYSPTAQSSFPHTCSPCLFCSPSLVRPPQHAPAPSKPNCNCVLSSELLSSSLPELMPRALSLFPSSKIFPAQGYTPAWTPA